MVLRVRLPDPPVQIQDPAVRLYLNDLIRTINAAFDNIVYNDTLVTDLEEIFVEGSAVDITFNTETNSITFDVSA